MRRRSPFLGLAGLGLILAAATVTPRVSSSTTQDGAPNLAPTAEQAAFFEKSIRPALIASCVACHNKDSAQGNLRLDIPLNPAQAKNLVARLRGEGGKPRMPMGAGPLHADAIAAFDAWAKMGAPWPKTASVGAGAPALWSLAPVRKPALPKSRNAMLASEWARNPIDHFVLAKLGEKALAPAPPADKRTLLRRLSYDLTGLPPTTAEVDTFLADSSENAYEKQVDRLLDSPRYGERQARFWLDIARYADTKGYVFNEDRNYPNAYTFRDWVIESFNRDLPYDQFIVQQLAADRLDLGENKKPLAAMGFLTVGRRFLNNSHDIIDDRIDVTTRGFLGLSVTCARCHDHKFDPVPAQDYYSLYSVFASTAENTPIISPREVADPWRAHDEKFQKGVAEREEILRSETRKLRERVKLEAANAAAVGEKVPDSVKRALQNVRENELPNGDNLREIVAAFPKERQDRMKALADETALLQKSYPPRPEFAMGLAESNLVTVGVFKRGNPGNQGEPAPRRFLKCVAGDNRDEWKQSSGRLELARAIASPENPFTARVMANRLWLQHFGSGIVRTPSDFGRQGEKPTHPELLDYLAWTFSREMNWSVKKLHRLIVTSATYRQSSEIPEKAFLADPENRLLSRQNRRKLDLEQLRDSLFWASGKLDTAQTGGKSVDLWKAPFTPRRAVYGLIERQNLPGIFKTLDFATPDASSPQRFKTTVPQQALFLLNAPLATEAAKSLSARPEIVAQKDTSARVSALYRTLFGRRPTANEASLAKSYLDAPDASGIVAGEPTWRYGWGAIDDATGKVSSFHPLGKFVDDMWRAGDRLPDPEHGWVLLTSGGGHPGSPNHAVIRRFTAQRDAMLAIDGTLKHGSKDGDGVRARIVHSRLGVLGDFVAANGETSATVKTFEIKAGETVDFVVDCRSSENSDSFSWAPVIRDTQKKMAIARADRDFSGPRPESLSPLSKWERYTQALLLTNEFLFVD